MTSGVLTSVLAFLLTVPWGSRVVRMLASLGIRKQIRPDGPSAHQSKAGTPTMGGLYILAAAIIAGIALSAAGFSAALLPLTAMTAFGLLGAYDDWQGLKDVNGIGWLARSKFPWQWAIALAVALLMQLAVGRYLLLLPFGWQAIEVGWVFLPIATVLLVVGANAVNLSDGLDGLTGGTSAVAFLAYAVMATLSGQRAVGLFSFALAGITTAFVWYNVNPARMFMGDVGSEALGAGLVVVALLSGHLPLLPIIGLVFVVEALSVMAQVGYFKYTRKRFGEGRRILRMAPIHHHFELSGWSEVQITIRCWIVAFIVAAIGLALGLS